MAITGRVAFKIEKYMGTVLTLILIGMTPIIAFFGISSNETWYGVYFCFALQFCRGLHQVILPDAFNKRISGAFRATGNSITQMGTRTLFVLLSPLIGYFIDKEGLSFTTAGLGCFFIVIFLFVLLPLACSRDAISSDQNIDMDITN